jgi:membrane-associated protease RseP (regulator of RpoE activity)
MMRKPISSCLVMTVALAFGALAPAPGQEPAAPVRPQPGQAAPATADPSALGILPENPHSLLFDYSNDPGDLQVLHQNHTLPHAGQAYWFELDAQSNSGMSLAAVDDTLRAHLKVPKDQGLIVTAVRMHSPAAQAGIQQNDVLLRLDRKQLGKPEDLEVGLKGAEEKPVSLVLLRSGREVTIKVQPRVSVSLGPVHPEAPAFWIGLSVAPIEPTLRAQLQLPRKSGLTVTSVVAGGPAAKAGIRPHDILLKIDGEEMTDQAKLVQVVQARGEKAIPVELLREGKNQTIEVTPETRKGLNRFSVTLDQPRKFYYYDVIHPGAVLGRPGGGESPGGTGAARPGASPGAGLYGALVRESAPREPREVNPTTAQRLDDLTAQVKELRQAIEALTKAAKEREKEKE